MKVKLTCDGTAAGARLELEDGTDLAKVLAVTGIEFGVKPGDVPEIRVTMMSYGEVDASGRLICQIYDPGSKKLRTVDRIVFADGAEWTAPK